VLGRHVPLCPDGRRTESIRRASCSGLARRFDIDVLTELLVNRHNWPNLCTHLQNIDSARVKLGAGITIGQLCPRYAQNSSVRQVPTITFHDAVGFGRGRAHPWVSWHSPCRINRQSVVREGAIVEPARREFDLEDSPIVRRLRNRSVSEGTQRNECIVSPEEASEENSWLTLQDSKDV
jgi:hypothetical protein